MNSLCSWVKIPPSLVRIGAASEAEATLVLQLSALPTGKLPPAVSDEAQPSFQPADLTDPPQPMLASLFSMSLTLSLELLHLKTQ